jgi:ribosomal protein L17
MRHGNHNRKFGRETDQRAALLKSLARSLVLRGRIKTTEAKAKEIRPLVEKLVTKGKSATIANRRLLSQQLGDSNRKQAHQDCRRIYKTARVAISALLRWCSAKATLHQWP